MKKILLLITSFFILIHISSCTGYKPIFDSTNFNFEIAKHTISGEKKLGNQIYFKLYTISNLNKNNTASKSIEILINVSKDKVATVKNNAGKILEYRINISTHIIVNDFLENKIESLVENKDGLCILFPDLNKNDCKILESYSKDIPIISLSPILACIRLK